MRVKVKEKRKIDVRKVMRNSFNRLTKPNSKNNTELQEVYYFNQGFISGMRYGKQNPYEK